MSSLNIKDKNKQWISLLSNDAHSITVNSPYFKETNLKSALERLRLDNVSLKENIAYLYQNGTLGGGGGGGGGTSSIGTIVSETFKNDGDTIYVDKNKPVLIEYRINYRRTEYFTINIKIAGTDKKLSQQIKSNETYIWDAGVITEQGSYYVEFSGINKDFEQLDILTGNIVIGAIELSSTFSENVIFSPARPISVSYFVNCKLSDPLTLVYNYGDGDIEIPNIKPNVQDKLTFGPLPARIYNFYMYVKAGDKKSNELRYTIKVANNENVFISIPNYAQTQYVKGETINLPYIISTLGAETYKITGKLSDSLDNVLETVETTGEIGYTNIISFNTDYPLGRYKITLRGVSVDNPDKVTEDDAIINIELIESPDFNIWGTSGEGSATLLADFNARSNNSSDTVWVNRVKTHPEIKVDLYNTNGYVSGFLPFSNSLSLKGESYAILHYKPFEDTNVVEDFAINFLYKANNNGDPNACVVSCGQYSINTNTLTYGFEITASQINVRTMNNSVTATSADDSWVDCTIVFEKVDDKIQHTGNDFETLYGNYFIKVYVDGVLSKANFIAADSAYQLIQNIYLGCRANVVADNIVLSNFSNCEIKNIRIYDIRLGNHQVVYNYISNSYWQNPIYEYDPKGNIIAIKGYDIQKQKALRDLNSYDKDGNFIFNLANPATCPLPILRITFDNEEVGREFYNHTRTTSWEGKDFDKKFPCKITYINKYDNVELVDIVGFISLQGTSSGEYLSKNYEIYFGEDSSLKPILFSPKEEWLPENQFTIKTNMMDSSHANNIGAGYLVNNYLYSSKLPPMTSTAANPNPYSSSVKYSLEGFPIHVGITFTGTKESYMGVHTFNMGRYSFFNLGLRCFKDLAFVNKNKNIGLVESYTENTGGIYGQSCAFEITTSNNLGSPAFRQYSDPWMQYFAQRYPIIERPHLPNARLKSFLQNTVRDIALSTQAGGIPELKLDGSPVTDNKGNIVYLPTDGKVYEDIPETDRNFMNDYLLFCYIIGLSDSLGKNMMLKSWGKEDGNADRFHWYPTFYDMDTCLGVSNDGQLDFLRCGPSMDISSFKDGRFDTGQNVYIDGEGDNTKYIGLGYGTYNLSNSLLWIQFMRDHRFKVGSKAVDMDSRYKELRLPNKIGVNAPFSVNNLFNSFKGIISKIGASFYNEDTRIKYLQLEEITDDVGTVIGATYKYVKNFLNGKREAYTKQWITQRIKYCDTIFNLSMREIPDNTVNKNIPMRFNSGTSQIIFPKLYVKTYSPMFPTFYWSGLDENSLTSKYMTGNTLNGATGEGVFSGQITASNQSSYITNAPDIEYIRNLKECNPSRLELGDATSLRELDLANKSSIEYLDIQTCKSLKYVYLNGCLNLRGVDGQLNVQGCESLEHLDISNTKIEKLVLSSGESPKVVLKTFKANNCNITSLDFKGQSYLRNIELLNCKALTDIKFDGCTSLTELNCSSFHISKIHILNCTSLESIDLSGCFKLNEVVISNCPKLKSINLSSSVSKENSEGAIIDLTGAYNLSNINLNGSNIRKITLHKELTSLKTINFSNSLISQTTFGMEDSVTLLGEPLIDLTKQGDLHNCFFTRNTNIEHIYFNKMYLENVKGTFDGCSSLKDVQGSVYFKGKMESTFTGCNNLLFANIVFIDNGITNADSIFQNCRYLTYEDMLRFIDNTTSTSTYIATFMGAGINTAGLLENLFTKHANLIALSNMYMGCRNMLITLSDDFFVNCQNVTRIDKMFSGSGISGIPSNILKPLTKLEMCDEMFSGSYLVSELDGAELFKYNTKLKNLSGVFKGCRNLTINLPGGVDSNAPEVKGEGTAVLFVNNPEITDTNSCFSEVTINGKINADTFKNNKLLTDVSNTFSYTGLHGYLSTELFSYTPDLKYAVAFIRGTNITKMIPHRLFANAPKLIDITQFFMDTDIITGAGDEYIFGDDILKDNTELQNIQGLFSGCKGLRGKIPRRVFKKLNKLRRFTGVFENCINIVGEIPHDLFLIESMRPEPSLVPGKLVACFDATGKSNTDANKNVWTSTDGKHTMNLKNFNFDGNDGWHNNALKFTKSKNVCELTSMLVNQYYNTSVVIVLNKKNSDDCILFNGNNTYGTDMEYNSFHGFMSGNSVGVNNKFSKEGASISDISLNRDTVVSFVINASEGKNELLIDGVFKETDFISTGTGHYINNTLTIGNAKTLNQMSRTYDYNITGEFEIKKILFYNNSLSVSENDQIYQKIATIPLIPYENYISLDVNELPDTPKHIFPDARLESNTINVFKGCIGLTHNFANNVNFAKFFQGMIKTYSIEGFFSDCANITGSIPKTLLNNLRMLKSVQNLFSACPNIKPLVEYDANNNAIYYFLHPEFFKHNMNIESVGGLFRGWNFVGFNTAIIPDDIFKNLKDLRSAGFMLAGTYLPKGIPDGLFQYNHNLADISYFAFRADYNNNRLASRLFAPYTINDKVEFGNKLTNANYAFAQCYNIKGEPVEFWNIGFEELLKNNFSRCYQECTNLTGYDSFPNIAK